MVINIRHSDSRFDIVIVDNWSGDISVVFRNLTTYLTDSYSSHHSLVLSDINNHIKLDIIVTNRDSNNLDVLVGYGNGTDSLNILLQIC